jgi:hypothetical protein
LIDGPIVVVEFGDMEEKDVNSFHQGNSKMPSLEISTPSPNLQRAKRIEHGDIPRSKPSKN